MTLADAILQAEREPNLFQRVKLVREVANFMRFQLGWSYEKSVAVVVKTGVSAERWEELLMEVDSNGEA